MIKYLWNNYYDGTSIPLLSTVVPPLIRPLPPNATIHPFLTYYVWLSQTYKAPPTKIHTTYQATFQIHRESQLLLNCPLLPKATL